MRRVRVKALWKALIKFIPDPTKQQWRAYKRNYKKGLL